MKQILFTALILIVAVCIPAVQSADTKGNAADEAAIRAAVAGYNDARNAGNAEAMADFYTTDAQEIGNSGHVTAEGRPALEKYFATWSQDPRYKGMRATREVTNIRFVTPEIAVVTVTGAVTRSGEERPIRLLDVDLMRKQDGKWLIASQHNLGLSEPPARISPPKK